MLREANVPGALSTAPVLLLAARLLAAEEVLAISVPACDHLLDGDGEDTVVDSDMVHCSFLVCCCPCERAHAAGLSSRLVAAEARHSPQLLPVSECQGSGRVSWQLLTVKTVADYHGTARVSSIVHTVSDHQDNCSLLQTMADKFSLNRPSSGKYSSLNS